MSASAPRANAIDRPVAKKERRIVQKIVKTILLVLVPVIAAAVIIGVSLQLIGIPVWQTTLGYIHGQSKQPGPASAQAAAMNQMKVENDDLTKQVTSLTSELGKQKAAAKTLQAELTKAQTELQTKRDAIVQAKEEAQIVTQMDPAAAAQVVAKLPESEAGLVIASLSPSAASQVLAAMDPAAAAKLLELAGQSNTNVTNSTG